MSVWSHDQTLHASYQSNGNKTSKMKRKSFSFLSKSGSRKWRSNNIQLARENCRLRKDLQKCKELLTEYTINYNILEVSWRRRGEMLSKIDLKSRMVGNQILKVVDSLAEIRSACQAELSVPVGGKKADNAEHISRCRHTMPNMKMGKYSKSHNVSPLSTKSRMISRVKPMIHGHVIIKPTITLQRLRLEDVPSSSSVEQMRSPLQELDEGQIEEVDVTNIAENSPDPVPYSCNSDEEEVVELSVTPSMRRMSACPSPPSYRNMILPVAEVPLERLSLERMLERHKNTTKRNLFSRLLMHDKTESTSNCVNATSPHISMPSLHEQEGVTDICSNTESTSNCVNATSPHVSMPSLHEQEGVIDICNNSSPEETTQVNAVYSVSKDTKDLVDITSVVQNESKLTDHPTNEYASRTLEVTSSSICSSTATSNWQPNNTSVRKYPPSRTKTPKSPEVRMGQINGVGENCRLVVALEDISGYLQNGMLVNIEQLEEGKVKTDVSAHPESKTHNSEDGINGNKDLEISMLDMSVENETQLNFTAGIGTLDYSTMSLNNSDTQGRYLSAKEEFLNRIQNEDPLEGPSWRFHSDGTPTGKRSKKSKSTIKGNSGSEWSDQSACIASKKQSSDTSNHQRTENHPDISQTGKEAIGNDDEMDITECIVLCDVKSDKSTADRVLMGKETNSYSVHTSYLCKARNSEVLRQYFTEEVILSRRKRPDVKYSDTLGESEDEWKPKKKAKKKCSRSKADSSRMNGGSLSRNMKTERSRPFVVESAANRKPPVEHTQPWSIYQIRETSPQLEYKETAIKKEDVGNANEEEHVRVKRRAAPVCLKEVSLRRKLRRDTH